MTKRIVTILYDEDDEVIGRAETKVETLSDIERHLENWHGLETQYKRHEQTEEEQIKDAEEIINQ